MKLIGFLKKKSITGSIVAFIALCAVAGVLMFLNGSNVFMLINPPNLATLELDENVAGQYVEFDIEMNFDYYAVSTVNDKVTSYEQMVFSPEWDYLLGVIIPAGKYENTYFDAFEDQWDSYVYDDVIKTITVKGTLQRMDSDSVRLFNNALDYYEIDRDHAFYYYLNMDQVGHVGIVQVLVLAGLALLCVLLGIFFIIKAVLGMYQKPLRQWAAATGNDEAGYQKLDDLMDNGFHPNKHMWMNNELLVWKSSIRNNLRPTNDIVWAYKKTVTRNGVESGHSLMLGIAGTKKIKEVSMSKDAVAQCLAFFETSVPHVALGYNAELAGMFKSNPEGLRAVGQQQRDAIRNMNQPAAEPAAEA